MARAFADESSGNVWHSGVHTRENGFRCGHISAQTLYLDTTQEARGVWARPV